LFESLDGGTEIRFRSLYQEMVVVGHETVGVDNDGKAVYGCFNIFEEFFFVAFSAEYVFSVVPSVDDLVIGSRIFYA
jgi:hypothetical protein